MFGNFLYYIIALLIYSTYQPPAEAGFGSVESIALFIGLSGLFFVFTHHQFQKIEERISQASSHYLDNLFHSALTRQSILAIFIFSVDIYALNLGRFVYPIPLFQKIPTLEALVFMALFIGYLAMVWGCAYDAFAKIYRNGLTRKHYILSNISFSVPVILPWLLLSITSDVIHLLPFDAPREFLGSTEGQISYFMGFLVAIAIIGPVLIQKFWGCRPLRPGVMRHRIEAICRKADMDYRDIMVWPLFGGRMITAGVMGLVRRFRYILVTPALMQHLEPWEIDAVIAHEIGHIKKYHLFFYLIFFAGYLAVSFTALDLVVYAVLYAEAAWGAINPDNSSYATLSSISFSLFMIGLFLVYFRYIFGYFMRNFERQADGYAYLMLNDAGPLISTFEKITITSGQAPDRPNWHHFSIKERIDFLKACASDPSRISRHNTKVRASMAIYLAAVFLVSWAGFRLHYDQTGGALPVHVLKKIVEHQMRKNPANPDLVQLMGDIYFEEQDFAKAVEFYEKTLDLAPDHVRALNNLAWLHATCEDPKFFDPEKALTLAIKAAALSDEPHVLDTLAEAWYVNGHIQEAIAAAAKALDRAGNDSAYYRSQLEKFQSAGKSS
ncbi:MAG: peptidase [Desulfobacterales bacterium CG23_combo_of_CG06-09_8_20_14_all_51_8]|nr:MAG: peptidase [Desulfobacterales bacterium CG23_combo_of_CG06-09_8_20_14_all_51_8]